MQQAAARVTAIPLGRQSPGASSNLPGRQDPDIDPGDLPAFAERASAPSLFGLAPGGVCHAVCVAADAVRSYRTLSPLPLPLPDPPPRAEEGWVGVRRSALCGTFPRLAPAGRYPAPYVHGARTFLPGHLSVLAGAAVQPTDPAVNGHPGPPRQGLRLARRELVWINVTRHPTAEWIAQQITEAFPWNEAPRYLIRDRDAIYGAAVTRRLRAMGIRDKPDCCRLAVAEWLRGEADRHDTPRVLGSGGVLDDSGLGDKAPGFSRIL